MREARCLIAGLLLAFGVVSGAAFAENASIEALLASAGAATGGKAAEVTTTPEGYVQSVAAPEGGEFPVTGVAKGAEESARALAFLDANRAVFAVKDAGWGFSVARKTASGIRRYVRLQQAYDGLPVLGGQSIIQMNEAGGLRHVLFDAMRDAELAPLRSKGLSPAVPPDRARAAAAKVKLEKAGKGAALEASSEPELMIYAPRVLGRRGAGCLAWRVVVSAANSALIREMVFVDAHTGRVVFHYPLVHDARYRQIYDSNNTEAEPGSLMRSEGGLASSITDVNQAYDYYGDTYDFYKNEHNRDSIDGFGMIMSATTRQCPYGTAPEMCPWANASWDGTRMHFGQGFAVDDVVGHELTHGVTEHESNLIYEMQSGAINESFSDIWGEFIDLVNGKGTDTPEVRWLMGEDIPVDGALRSMKNPPQFNDPDRMYSPNYYTGQGDGGGVHTNSGVGNKLAYLLVDGETFNGRSITGMGIPAVADLFYEAQCNLLTEGSDYADLYTQLKQAAINLGFSQDQKNTLERACRAVEIGGLPLGVTGLSAETAEGDPNITLHWTNPAGKAFLNVVVRRKTDGYPAGPTDGDLAYSGTGNAVVDGPLTVGTRYYYAVFAYHGLDEFGEASYAPPATTRVRAGMVVPLDYFSETWTFDENMSGVFMDLAYTTLTFTPVPGRNRYTAKAAPATAYPVNPAESIPLTLYDDDYTNITLTGGNSIPFYGVSYDQFYVNSNGNVSFTAGDLMPNFFLTFDQHFSLPRVSALFSDLDPATAGAISWQQLADRAVITYDHITEYYDDPPSSNNFQIELFFSGVIRITYLGIENTWGLAGLSIGEDGTIPDNFVESDLSSYLEPDSDADGIPDSVEGTGDSNGDGTPDYLDDDSDGDSVPDAVETASDSDGDLIPNYLDPDSDDDGIADSAESGSDTDRDGLPNFIDGDSDGDGLDDTMEGTADIDHDGQPNYLDRDSDGDGLDDNLEWLYGSDPYDEDSTAELPVGMPALAGLMLAMGFAGILLLRRPRRTLRG